MLSPQKAAAQAQVSRKTIMDQIHAGKLNATRNNHNRWQIAPEDLDAWLSDRAPVRKTEATTNTYSDILKKLEQDNVTLKVSLEATERLVAELREDREHWREQASLGLWQRLFNKPRT